MLLKARTAIVYGASGAVGGAVARDSRQLSTEVGIIEDPTGLAQKRRQARRVQFKAILTAVPMTLIGLALP